MDLNRSYWAKHRTRRAYE